MLWQRSLFCCASARWDVKYPLTGGSRLYKGASIGPCVWVKSTLMINVLYANIGPRIHCISIHRFPKSTDVQMIFGCQYSNIHTSVDIQEGISMQRHSTIDIRKYPWMNIHILWISVFNHPCFYGYPFGYSWISMDIHALTCYGFSIQGRTRAPSQILIDGSKPTSPKAHTSNYPPSDPSDSYNT